MNTSYDKKFTFLIDYTLVCMKVYGLEKSFEILETLELEQYNEIYMHISKYSPIQEIEHLVKSNKSVQRNYLFLCRAYIQNGNKEKAKKIVEENIL